MSERDDLEDLFRQAHAHVPEQPFVNATLLRVAAQQRRAAAARATLMAGGIALIALLSPWLIRGAQLLLQGLDSGFARIGDWLDTPWGIAGVAVVVALAARRFLSLSW